MIHYNLRCDNGHHFDGWFASSSAFVRLADEHLLSCSACGSAVIERALMAPALSRSRGEAQPVEGPPPVPAASPAPANVVLVDERRQKMRAVLQAMREVVMENGTDVGRDFPDEARRIHYGEAEPRSIYGQADKDEARELIEEGVAILPLPPVDDSN